MGQRYGKPSFLGFSIAVLCSRAINFVDAVEISTCREVFERNGFCVNSRKTRSRSLNAHGRCSLAEERRGAHRKDKVEPTKIQPAYSMEVERRQIVNTGAVVNAYLLKEKRARFSNAKENKISDLFILVIARPFKQAGRQVQQRGGGGRGGWGVLILSQMSGKFCGMFLY